MKTWYYYLLITLVSFFAISCGDDNDEPDGASKVNITEEALVGRWAVTSYVDKDENESRTFNITPEEIETGINVGYRIDFISIDSGRIHLWGTPTLGITSSGDLNFKWRLKNNVIYAKFVSSPEFPWYIEKFDGNTMTISYRGNIVNLVKTNYKFK